jgi:ketosteroid isomerase-like protein
MAALRLSLLGCAVLALGACQPKGAVVDTPVDLSRDADAIKGAETDRVSAMNDRDLEQASDFFTSTAVVAWPGGKAIRGQAQIRSALAESFKDPAFKVEWHTDHILVAKEGDMAWAIGDYSLTHTDPVTKKPVTAKGPYMESFTKGPDGRWLIVAGVSSAAASSDPD